MSDKIQKLTDFLHARRRTEMYLSSRDPHTQTVLEYDASGPRAVETTWVPAVFTAYRELLDNALDEMVTHGHGNRLDITYDEATASFSISDSGRGIPIDFDPSHNTYLATMALTETKAGRNFGERGASRGLNGVGASVVNFCSSTFDLEVHRDGRVFQQRFHEGDGSNVNLVIDDPVITSQSGRKQTGTKVSARLSPKVFHDLRLPERFVAARVAEVALCYPNLRITFNGHKVASKGVAGLFPGRTPTTFRIDEKGFHSQFWLVANFMADGSEYQHSLVNAIPTFNGGTHIEAFRRGFFSGLLAALERESKRRRLQPNRSDLADGMLIYNITQMDEPQFDSQSKTRLINEQVAGIVRRTLDDPDFFKGVIRANKDWIEAVYARCAERTMKKDSAEASKLAKKNLRQKVEDLEDACGSNRSKCVLFLGEGKSAISGMVEARNPELHGGLPLRGKVLNVHGESHKTVLENEALAKIMQAVGLVPGSRANRHLLRYGHVYITTDADEDGKNIAALLVNFFFTLWPELFEADKPAFLSVFDTPLIIAVKGKARHYFYNENYADFDADEHKGWEVTRAKGLAALKREDWRYVLEHPRTHPIIDDGRMQEALSLLFDPKRADNRKAWIGM